VLVADVEGLPIRSQALLQTRDLIAKNIEKKKGNRRTKVRLVLGKKTVTAFC